MGAIPELLGDGWQNVDGWQQVRINSVLVYMKDIKHRMKRKQPITLRPAAKKSPASQRDQNLAQPSAGQSVAGATPLVVNEAGAPASVAAPPGGAPLAVAAPVGAPQMSTRMRNKLLKMMEQPALGCSTCRKSPIGYKECRHTRDCWLFCTNRIHQLDEWGLDVFLSAPVGSINLVGGAMC